MSNSFAVVLGVLILSAIGADYAMNDSAALLFLGRKFVDLIEYLAFWR